MDFINRMLGGLKAQGKVVVAAGVLTAVMQTYEDLKAYEKSPKGFAFMPMATKLAYTAFVTVVSAYIADAIAGEGYAAVAWAFVLAPLLQAVLVSDLTGKPMGINLGKIM